MASSWRHLRAALHREARPADAAHRAGRLSWARRRSADAARLQLPARLPRRRPRCSVPVDTHADPAAARRAAHPTSARGRRGAATRGHQVPHVQRRRRDQQRSSAPTTSARSPSTGIPPTRACAGCTTRCAGTKDKDSPVLAQRLRGEPRSRRPDFRGAGAARRAMSDVAVRFALARPLGLLAPARCAWSTEPGRARRACWPSSACRRTRAATRCSQSLAAVAELKDRIEALARRRRHRSKASPPCSTPPPTPSRPCASSSSRGRSPRSKASGRELVDLLLMAFLESRIPVAHGLRGAADAARTGRRARGQRARRARAAAWCATAYRLDRWHLDRLPALLSDPLAVLRAEYGNALQTAADATRMADKLFPRLAAPAACARRLLPLRLRPGRCGLRSATRPR